MQVGLERFVGFVILMRGLRPRCAHGIGPGQPALSDEAFGLTGVSLILDTVLAPRDDSIEGSSLLRVVRARTETRANGDLVFRGYTSFKPIQCVGRTAGCEVVPMDRAGDTSLLVPEHVWAG